MAAVLLASVHAQPPAKEANEPVPEKLTYRVEWRLITAGSVNLQVQKAANGLWETNLDIESAGLVTRLYRVLDKYKVLSNGHFCPVSSYLDAQEGKKHTITRLTFDDGKHRVDYNEQDLVKNSAEKKSIEIAPCTYEIAGALAELGRLDLQPGKSASLPITDGKKMVFARVQALAKEAIDIDGKTYHTVRYEAFLFDNVLYKRKGRLFVWLTDDEERLPVQFKMQLGFPIGAIALELEKRQKL